MAAREGEHVTPHGDAAKCCQMLISKDYLDLSKMSYPSGALNNHLVSLVHTALDAGVGHLRMA